MESLTCILIFL